MIQILPKKLLFIVLICMGTFLAGYLSKVHAQSEETQKLQAKTATFYVALNGNDRWSGKLADPTPEKTDGPFRTMERAKDEVRRLKASVSEPFKGAEVIVRAGEYQFTQSFTLKSEDSGLPNMPVVYRAYPGEKVTLTGGQALPPKAFKPVTDNTILKRLDLAARSQVFQADLLVHGIVDLGKFPIKFTGALPVPELFFNGQRMTLARWPNKGWATIEKIISPGGATSDIGDKSDEGGVFEYLEDRPSRWNVKDGIWLHGFWCFDWYDEFIQIQSIDPRNHRITLAAPSVYGLKQGNSSPRRYYALNVLEELNNPGEYYVDRTNGFLYFWPPVATTNAYITLSMLKTSVVEIKDATDVTLRGFIIEETQGNGINISGGKSVHIEACEIRNIGRLAIDVSGGLEHKIEACDIHDIGTGGIVLYGGNRKTLTSSGHEAINNHIWRFSINQLTYASAITLKGVGNRAAHNLIHDAPHMAINIQGNDNIFEYNIVHDVVLESDDAGALYKGRNPSCRGNIIRYNFWHHIGSPMGVLGNAAIYFDDGDGGDIVFGNVFFRCGSLQSKGPFGAVYSHGGHDIQVENNIFIECQRAFGSVPWNNERWNNAIKSSEGGWNWHYKLFQEVDIAKTPYSSHYPELMDYVNKSLSQPRINWASNNVFVRCANVSNGNWHVLPNENWSTDNDPGFLNATKGDFQLRSDSVVFIDLPGFRPIPFEKIGLVKNVLRQLIPFEAWPDNRL